MDIAVSIVLLLSHRKTRPKVASAIEATQADVQIANWTVVVRLFLFIFVKFVLQK